MNRKEFLEKYKDVDFRFVGYYKYKFHYEAQVDGDKIEVWLSDSGGDIYRNRFLAVEKVSEFTLIFWTINGGVVEG